MTNEQLERAKTLQAEIQGCKADLERVCDFQGRSSEACSRGICIANGLNYDTVIVPRKEEINALLITMRNRIEKRIAELEKEFAEL